MTPENEFEICPWCSSTNIFEDDGWWYCNACGEIWNDAGPIEQ